MGSQNYQDNLTDVHFGKSFLLILFIFVLQIPLEEEWIILWRVESVLYSWLDLIP